MSTRRKKTTRFDAREMFTLADEIGGEARLAGRATVVLDTISPSRPRLSSITCAMSAAASGVRAFNLPASLSNL